MGISVYIEELKQQSAYAFDIAKTYREYVGEIKRTMNMFFDCQLESAAYDATREYFMEVYLPLMNGLDLVSLMLMDAHDTFVHRYQEDVATVDLEEDTLLDQLGIIRTCIQNLYAQQATMPCENPYVQKNIELMEQIYQKISKKLEALYHVNQESSSFFREVEDVLRNVERGLQAVEEGKGWDDFRKCFDVKNVDVSWSKELKRLCEANKGRVSLAEQQLQAEGKAVEELLATRKLVFDRSVHEGGKWLYLSNPPDISGEDLRVNERYDMWLRDVARIYGQEAAYGEKKVDVLTILAMELRDGVEYRTGRKLNNIEMLQRQYAAMSMVVNTMISGWYSSNALTKNQVKDIEDSGNLSTPKYDTSKLQHEFKHAKDFGIDGNWNTANGDAFKNALNSHVNSSDKILQSTYRGNDVIVYINSSTGNGTYFDLSGNFVGGWKFSAEQLQYHLQNSIPIK